MRTSSSPSGDQNTPLPSHRPDGPFALAGAAILGLLLSNFSIFVVFLLFNFILHWRS